jgi:hypothetical protein
MKVIFTLGIILLLIVIFYGWLIYTAEEIDED